MRSYSTQTLTMACEMLLARAGLERLWTYNGPTHEAYALLDAEKRALSRRQRVLLTAALAFWDSSHDKPLSDEFGGVEEAPTEEPRRRPAQLNSQRDTVDPRKGAIAMQSLEGKRIIITGGSSGLGLALTEALVEHKAVVTVLARDASRLAEVKGRLGVAVVAGDITDRALTASVLRNVRPDVIVLNAGVKPAPAPIHEQTWETFSDAWNTDIKAALDWIQESIALPLTPGSRMLLGSSGAAMGRSPLAGGLSGAKRAMWSMAHYANFSSEQLKLGIRFQAIVPMQIFADTEGGRVAAQAYATLRGIPIESFIRKNFGNAMTPRDFAEHVVTILTDPGYEGGTVYGLKPEVGIASLDG
jgi:NAD(P)-dependent dehydrogenase (short-subunit alcohol dehydrogenase family)